MDTFMLEVNFHDPQVLHAAGLRVSDLSSVGQERARFRVVSRAHLFGTGNTHRVQMNVELLVLHRP